MTVFTGQQGFQFRITNVSGRSFDYSTMQNVQKRVEKILYLESPPADAVLLSYVGSKELSPENNLFIGDRSDSLYANSRTGKVQELIGDVQESGSVDVRNSNFIVTQVFNNAGTNSIPLYYNYILPLTIIPESIRVYDKDFQIVSTDRYKLEIQQEYDEDTGIPKTDVGGNPVYTEYHLYNDLESSYDATTGEYTVYYVQYTNTSGGSDSVTTELLGNDVAYREADYEDIWDRTLELKPWVNAYLWDPTSMSVTFPANGDYAIRYEEQKRMRVHGPSSLTDIEPWFPRISNTRIVTSYGQYTMTFQIPEFETQAFNPLEPYKIAIRQTCKKMDDYLLKLPNENIKSGATFSYLDIVFEVDGIVQYAVTNNPYKAGTQYKDFDNRIVYNSNGNAIVWSSDNLLGVDQLSGICHVAFPIQDSYEIYASYSYSEEYYELTGLNMNPVFDPSVHNEIRAVYIVPASLPNGNETTQTESIRWVRVSPSGKITYTNQDGSGNPERLDLEVSLASSSGYKLSGIIGMHYNWRATAVSSRYQDLLPNMSLDVISTDRFPKSGWLRFEDHLGVIRYAKFVDKTDTSFELSSSEDEVASETTPLFVSGGTSIELVNFVDERTTATNRTYEYEDSHKPSIAGFYPSAFSRYFLLAEMSVNAAHSYNDLVQIDVRRDGGGINPDKYDEAKSLNPQAQWFSDTHSYDGQVYPGNAVIVIKLPVSILERFSEPAIKAIIENNIPVGAKPIIRYYGYQPNILNAS